MAQEVSQPAQEPQEPEGSQSDAELIEQERAELRAIAESLEQLVQACTQTLEATAEFADGQVVQERLYVFSQSLALAPKSLQLLNDFRRHFPHIGEFSERVRQQLIERRGGEEDALSSEEGRIIVSAGSARDIVLAVITSLEDLLSQLRMHTPRLLSLIAYDGDHFEEEALQVLPLLRIDLVGARAHDERERLLYLEKDLGLLSQLAAHARELS